MANEKENPGATKDAGARRGPEAGKESEEAARAGEQRESATRRAAEAARELGEDTGRTGRSMQEQGAEAGKRMARGGAEMGERGAEAMRETTANTMSRMAEESTQQFGKVFGMSARTSEEVAQQTSQNFDVMMQCGTILADGIQSIWREWLNYTQQAMQKNMDGLNNMMRSRSVEDFVAAQTSLMRGEMEVLLNSSVKISELSAQVANDAVQRIHEQGEQQGEGRQAQAQAQPTRRRA